LLVTNAVKNDMKSSFVRKLEDKSWTSVHIRVIAAPPQISRRSVKIHPFYPKELIKAISAQESVTVPAAEPFTVSEPAPPGSACWMFSSACVTSVRLPRMPGRYNPRLRHHLCATPAVHP
jgi:hypothetical protein